MEVPNRLQLADAAIRLSRLEGEIRERAWRYALNRLTPDERIKVIEEENEAALRIMANHLAHQMLRGETNLKGIGA